MIDLHISWRQISQWKYELLFFSIYKLHLTCFLAVFHYTFTFLIVCKWYSAIVLQSSQKLASLCKEIKFYHNIGVMCNNKNSIRSFSIKTVTCCVGIQSYH